MSTLAAGDSLPSSDCDVCGAWQRAWLKNVVQSLPVTYMAGTGLALTMQAAWGGSLILLPRPYNGEVWAGALYCCLVVTAHALWCVGCVLLW